jgi:glyoxylase-like metal-dependent hydrolase (beta-lactamase superfamily II)
MTFQHGQITNAISFVDNGLLGSSGVGTTYVVRGDEIAIVETGTSFCAPTIIEGLTTLGVQPSDVRHILLTHIHMDHAGGAGLLVDAMPEAHIYIHSLTQQHLVEPERLISSAQRALGELFPAHGTIKPLAPEKLTPAEDLDLDLGRGIHLRAIATPGHSPDHLSYYETSSGALFSGDAVGVVLPAFHYLGPVTPPPTVDVGAQHATFRRLLDLPIEHLLFSHWGPSLQPAHAVIRRLQDRYDDFDRLVQTAMEQGEVDETAIIRAMLPDEPLPDQGIWLLGGWVRMSVKGMVRYHTKRREAGNQ